MPALMHDEGRVAIVVVYRSWDSAVVAAVQMGLNSEARRLDQC